MRADVTKLEILTDRATGNPLFYCHAADRDHQPYLEVSLHEGEVRIAATLLFKVKANPQTKNRIDIYMTVEEARRFGSMLAKVAGTINRSEPALSSARPHDARRGGMELPDIIWARYLKSSLSAARTDSGIFMRVDGGWVNIDFEMRHETHIKMGEREIHLGITLADPKGAHDPSKATLVHVDPSELQRPRDREPERNPVPKVNGQIVLLISRSKAAGLGHILQIFDENEGIA